MRLSKMVVEVIDKTKEFKEGGTAASSPVENVTADTNSSIKNAKGTSVAKTMMIIKVVNEVSSQVKRMATSTGNRYFNLTEDYMAENQMNLIDAYVGRAKTLASDLYSGAKIGAMVGGPIGAVVGLIGGIITYEADKAITIRQRESQWYSQLNATNAQTGWQQARLGLIDNGRGTEN